MLRATLKADTRRLIHVSLHPKEKYSELELSALGELIKQQPRLILQSGDSAGLVAGCDYVVTQNSALALDGYFHRKPAILFAAIDFHHIAANVSELGVEKAFTSILTKGAEFDQCLYWFLQVRSINAGRDDAEAKILSAVQRHGWRV